MSLHWRTWGGEKRRRKLAAGRMASKQNMEEDIIHTLKNFSNLDYQSQLDLIDQGRSMPEIRDALPKSSRSFRTDWYARKDWLVRLPGTKSPLLLPLLALLHPWQRVDTKWIWWHEKPTEKPRQTRKIHFSHPKPDRLENIRHVDDRFGRGRAAQTCR